MQKPLPGHTIFCIRTAVFGLITTKTYFILMLGTVESHVPEQDILPIIQIGSFSEILLVYSLHIF